MKLDKVAELDGRKVWLAILSDPDDPASWDAATPDFGLLACLDGWDENELAIFAAAAAARKPSEAAFAGEEAESALDALRAAAPKIHATAREEEPLDESVWYMFYANTKPDPVTRVPPPLIVALRSTDPRIGEFKLMAGRFAEAMNDVLERD